MTGSPQQYWLMKSEPHDYSIDDLARDTETWWTGIRNYQVRNMLRDQVRVGDRVLFYHSNIDPGVVGEMEVVGEAEADPTQFDKKSDYYDAKASSESPRWFAVKVKFLKRYTSPVSLVTIKSDKMLQNMTIALKGSRLSVTPVTKAQFHRIQKLAQV